MFTIALAPGLAGSNDLIAVFNVPLVPWSPKPDTHLSPSVLGCLILTLTFSLSNATVTSSCLTAFLPKISINVSISAHGPLYLGKNVSSALEILI